MIIWDAGFPFVPDIKYLSIKKPLLSQAFLILARVKNGTTGSLKVRGSNPDGNQEFQKTGKGKGRLIKGMVGRTTVADHDLIPPDRLFNQRLNMQCDYHLHVAHARSCGIY